MSSVSGGSLATAYFAMKKPPHTTAALEGTRLSPPYERFFTKFKEDMQINFQRRAFFTQMSKFRALNPTKSAYSFADVWNDAFFDEASFSDLYEREKKKDAPQIILNGTIYNSGRRLAMTTLAPSDFSFEFAAELRAKLAENEQQFTKEGRAGYDKSLRHAKTQFIPQTFEGLAANHHTLPIALAVATSASFPPVVGPVTYQTDGGPAFTHVGDGGLFDNLGTESLITLFLNKLKHNSGGVKKALILVIDASYPFEEGNADLDRNDKGFEVFVEDPSRIVGIMEERANAYQAMLWHSIRAQTTLLPDYDHLKLIILKHTEAEWRAGDPIPEACPQTMTTADIAQTIRSIPTMFKIEDPCHGALLIAAAHKVVEKQRQRIVDFLHVSQ